MKKFFLLLTVTAALAACNSKRKGSSISSASTTAAPQAKVSYTKQTDNSATSSQKSHLDSLLNATDGSSSYFRGEPNFQGVSGVGTGGSYAAQVYAREKMKKKKPAKTQAASNDNEGLNYSVIFGADSTAVVDTASGSATTGWDTPSADTTNTATGW